MHGITASGNPLIANRDIARLRQAHRVDLSRLGVTSLKAKLLTAGIVCDHAAGFWCNRNDEDTLLHAIFVVGLKLGLRFDEVGKISLEYMSVTNDSVTLRTDLGVKNQASQRSYKLKEWSGNTQHRGSPFMDPKVPLLTWQCVRGTADGFLFCHITRNKHRFCKINSRKLLSASRFN